MHYRILIALRSLVLLIFVTASVSHVYGGGLLPDSANRRVLNVQSQAMIYNPSYFDDKIKAGLGGKTPEELAKQISQVNCGSVSIGSVQTNSTMISTNIQVVIVGDVINVGNRC